jgi:E3 ubiquitin-protein transferase RMND5
VSPCIHSCCGKQASESPLLVSVAAGSVALPTLLKLATVMAGQSQDWNSSGQLPVELELGREFVFHSIFACPVSREQSTHDNPPMMLPCGHVLCRQSIQKMAKSTNRTFKCPYCPVEASLPACKQIWFPDVTRE